ncbi:TlpA disulfide reductase family protein [Pedobacter heparinus]|uniref:TlpA family protein disulfide reductase n=1 Tax=Pedobacter heparinus TaxID=984 RepID=UPI00292CBC98|nr:TlpA disulfide reductase family protein [Pedobacter heparinus]
MRKLKLTLILIVLGFATQAQQPNPVLLNQGQIVPDFTVLTPDGGKMRLLETVAQSEYTLIDFWGSWCVPCRAAFPKLKQLYAKWYNKGFNIIGIADDTDKAWKKALAEDKTPWMQGRDTDGSIHKLFNVQTVPAYVLVDSKGKLVAASGVMELGIPLRDAAALDAGLEKLLSEIK